MNNPGQQLETCRHFFRSGATRPLAFRRERLLALRAALYKYEEAIYDALRADLHKGPEEVWITETGFVHTEISLVLKKLRSWMKPQRVKTNLVNLPSASRVLSEPLGVVLVIGPWNYPLQLLFMPLVGAIAAGNCVVLKPSEFAPATAAVMKRIIGDTFPPEYVLFTEGDGAVVVPELMNAFTFDHVFYTGSTSVGRLVYKMAADKLVPVTLELGGKSPCVIEADADIRVAAKRIMMTKFSNAGQMCVAPDHVLIHHTREQEFIDECRKALLHFFGEEAMASTEYGRIINRRQFDRLAGYLQEGKAALGGRYDATNLYIEPTLLTQVNIDSPVMREEIFGPLLPVIPFSKRAEAIAIIERNPNPLAFYIFTGSRANETWWLESISFGGGCVNNAALHLTNHALPFGGRGFSGTGKYHGRYSFDTFSHQKAVMRTPTWFDPAMKYPPFKGKLNLFRRIIR